MDGITNYYEPLVLSCIHQKLKGLPEARDDEYIADVACVALNKLPARYVRHIVDTMFFESTADIQKSNNDVEKAVNAAIVFICSRRDMSPDGTLATQTASAGSQGS